MDDSDFIFTRASRSPRAVAVVVLWWLALIILYVVFNAAPLILLILGIISLPALFDIGAGATSELRITHADIIWRSGRRDAKLPRGQLKSVRLDTRLDLSLRMTLITYHGGKIRLPYECVPNASQITAALDAQGIAHERHHFTFLS